MPQLPLFADEPRAWTVSELNRHVRELIETDYQLKDLWVSGEVSNLSRPSSGHVYFTLKDAGAQLRCVMWRTSVSRQLYLPDEGAAVEAHGKLGVYEAGGAYQLYVDEFRVMGAGSLYQQFEALKQKLSAEGLFDESRKRRLPEWPRRIGLVTSPTGAALRDILNTLRRRWPLAEVVLSPAPVQGDDAPPRLVDALNALNQFARPDVILLARGGGSIEDLWAFNDERVVRAVAASPIPVVTGVGHETDFTLADFAADLRAPTPTAAAELATPDRADLRASLRATEVALALSLSRSLRNTRWQLAALAAELKGLSPTARLANARQRVDEFTLRAGAMMVHALQLRRERWNGLALRLTSVSPLNVLARGYALVTEADTGAVVKSAAQVRAGERVRVKVSDGEFGAEVVQKA